VRVPPARVLAQAGTQGVIGATTHRSNLSAPRTTRRARVLTQERHFASIFLSSTEMANGAKKNETVLGTVTEALPDTLFRVRLDSGVEILAYLAGKMRLHRIRVLIGDRVFIEIDPYGGKGRIVKRL